MKVYTWKCRISQSEGTLFEWKNLDVYKKLVSQRPIVVVQFVFLCYCYSWKIIKI